MAMLSPPGRAQHGRTGGEAQGAVVPGTGAGEAGDALTPRTRAQREAGRRGSGSHGR
ncbi:hypothetical protein [Streptomyces sp. NPDC048272]|uniref:hypothetical protein n=1 Tax=Streptomyces sp. NPDC048272 TaxID=3154616 RepID=UPI00341DC788